MKVSIYNKSYMLKLLILTFLLFIIFCLSIFAYNCYDSYCWMLLQSDVNSIKADYQYQPNMAAPDSNYEGERPIPYNEYYSMWHKYYIDNSKLAYNEYQTFIILIVIVSVITIIYLIYLFTYIRKVNKLLLKIKKYRDYMLATGNNKLEDISKEFGESIEIVEANIQKAIYKHILRNVYLSKQTKEILIINKTSANKKVKGNIQNVNVENNVIIEDNRKNI